jgi:ABC-type polysaccharide/polyol phosphate transport system ATPase subunit
MNSDTIISLEQISKTFRVSDRPVDSIRAAVAQLFNPAVQRRIYALKDINLEIKQGEFIGLIGHNGSGKSTLLNLILGALKPDPGGKIDVRGKVMMLSLGLGFDNNLTARENIYINGSLVGLSLKRIGQKFDEIIDFAELEDFVDTKVKFFSRGMRMRLAFAVGIHAETEILLIDEFFGGVGDQNFKVKSEAVFKERLLEGKTIIFASHSMSILEANAARVYLLNYGNLLAGGPFQEVVEKYDEIMKEKREKRLRGQA